MAALTQVFGRLSAELAVWRTLSVRELLFDHRSTALTVLMLLVGIALLGLVIRALRTAPRARQRIVLPALVGGRAALPLVRHLPLLLVLAGVPAFAVALADPYTTVAQQRTTYPGRRIALLIDASSSMLKPFADGAVEGGARNRAAFFSSVAAAEVFIRQRRGGSYRDVIALIEFGDEAYVITPFTTDYDNVLLGAALIGDWSEFMRFPNQGTKIAAGIEEATRLFRTFDFLDASGNLMIIFSDGEDTQVTLHGRHIDEIMRSAIAHRIPVYLVRTNRDKQLGDIIPDGIWKPVVESTGGRFYPAANEQDVLRAIRDIDRRSPGTIEIQQYATNHRRFAPFALLAAVLWSLAALLKLSIPHFRTFP